MRNLFFLLTAATITVTSCSKSSHPAPPDNGCIERVVIPQFPPLTDPSQTRTVDSLFDVNHIDHSHYRWLYYHQDTVNGRLGQYVYLDQYANGLRIFNEQANVSFSNGVLFFSGLYPTQGTTLDTVPALSLSRLRMLFTADLRKHATSVDPSLTDSCYLAEFGYINMAAGNAPEHLVKAWLVKIKYSNMAYLSNVLPNAIYLDSNGQTLSFIGTLIEID